MHAITCQLEGCFNPVHQKKYCRKHFSAYRQYGNPDGILGLYLDDRVPCVVPECQLAAVGKGYCQKHNYRLKHFGDVNKVSRVVGENRKKHPVYKVYHAMLQRCNNPDNEYYLYYGGRGIQVCERWQGLKGFNHFIEDMGERPKGLTLERINNDGNYEPGNTKWATRQEQAINRRTPLINPIGYKGISLFKATGKYQAYINVDHHRIHLGYYKTLKEAIGVRHEAEMKYYKGT